MAGLAEAGPAIHAVRGEMMASAKYDSKHDEAGFGLVEIIVSMFLLALLAASFLPILVQGLTTSVRNSTIATGSQIVAQQLDEVRALASTCSAVSAFDDVTIPATTDERGTVFQPFREVVGTCSADPDDYPSVVEVRAWVGENGAVDWDDALTEAVTLVYLEVP